MRLASRDLVGKLAACYLLAVPLIGVVVTSKAVRVSGRGPRGFMGSSARGWNLPLCFRRSAKTSLSNTRYIRISSRAPVTEADGTS